MSGRRTPVSEHHASAGAEVLVPLREQGDKPPLFHIPAGYGDMRFFKGVVEGLGEGRPVYGLQPPREEVLHDVRQKSLNWLLSEYLKEIKGVQRTGPYHLCGFSGGGLLVVEMAKRLIDAGDDVAFLAAVDPPLQVPRWLTLFYMCLYKLCNLTPATDRLRWRIIRASSNRLLRWVSDEGMCTHMAIFKDLEIRSYPGRIVLVRPERSWMRLLNLTRIGRSWLKVARDGTEVYWTPGTHHTMLLRGHVEAFSAILRDCLARSENIHLANPSRTTSDGSEVDGLGPPP